MTLTQKILHYIHTTKADFNALALELFAHQYHNIEPYQRYCQQLNKTPDNMQTWEQVPAVSTEVFREFTLSTLPPSEARYVFQTSGTSKETKGKHYYHDMTLYDAVIRASFMKGIGLSDSDKTIFRALTPSFKEVPTSSLFYMFHNVLSWYGEANSQFYFHEDELDCDKLLYDLQGDIAHYSPVVLLGTAFSFLNFCDYLLEKSLTLKLPKGSRLLETGGLKGRTRSVSRDELYHLFETQLGLDLNHCYSEYGMTELSSQCYSQPNSHIFSSPHWMKTQIIHPETGNEVKVGETGLIQFFDLANSTAVSAIVTSDLAIKHVNGFELIGRAPKAVLRGCSTPFEKV